MAVTERDILKSELRWGLVVAGVVAVIFAAIVWAAVAMGVAPPSNGGVIDPKTLHLSREFAEANLGTPRNAVECSSVFAILQLLQNTDAVSIVSESVVRDHVRARILRKLPLSVGRDLKGFGVVTRKGEVLSPVASLFVQYLHDAARQFPLRPV